MKIFCMAAALTAALPQFASAAPITFFGENLSPGQSVTGLPLAARNNFVATLAPGVGIEDFESAVLPDISFPVSSGDVTATLSGASTQILSSPSVGRFATSGSSFVQTGSNDFQIDFTSPISAFGFYGTDIGDFDNGLTLRLTGSGGSMSDLAVGNTLGAPDGSLLFFGFLDLGESYSSIEFLNIGTGGDIFGFDDMIVGDRAQIVNPPPPIPLPAAAWMLFAGVASLAAVGRRKRTKQG